jgi:hypothetical protein
MGCTVFQILMSAKLQNLASKLQSAKTLLGVSIARVRRGSKAMAEKTDQVALVVEMTAILGVSLLHYVST